MLHVIDFWDDVYQYDPVRIVQFWNGGIAIFGAYLGGFAGGAIYITMRNADWLHRVCDNGGLRWTGLHRPFPQIPSVAHLADIASPALLIALAIGRIGGRNQRRALVKLHRFAVGLGLYGPGQLRLRPPASHPAVAYELIFCLVWAGVLWLMRDRIRPRGMLFALFFAATRRAGSLYRSCARSRTPTYSGSTRRNWWRW